MADERNWGPIMAMLAHLYGFRPWDVARLTPEQLEMYIENSGFVRLQRDMPQLTASFAKLDADARQKLVNDEGKDPDPNSIDQRAWRVFTKSYRTVEAEPEQEAATPLASLSPEAAEGIVQWWESGDLYKLPEGGLIWRTQLVGIHKQIQARAAQYKPASG